ncbi:MAG: PUA domain-containing protein [Candidatus Bathyarchaeia archaeon]|jgi:PUA domain protein
MRHLKDRESKQVIKEFVNQFPSSTDSLDSVKHLEEEMVEDSLVFFADGKPWIVRVQGRLFPSLKYDVVLVTLPKIVVDMGAIPHVANGAHVMRPGIRHIEGQFDKDDLVAIYDEKYGKIIALGIAEQDAESMRSMTKGRVIANMHYVGDPLWKSFTPSNRLKME